MSAQQRRPVQPDGTTYGDWPLPDAVRPDAPLSGDWYVTVDERVGGVVEVVVADWPQLDAAGLRFDGEISTASFEQADLQRTVDRLRGDAQQLQRPLRIGDSFWVRGSEPSSLETWQDLRDITGAARAMAKTVASVVAVGALYEDPDRVASLALADQDGDAEGARDSGFDETAPPGAATANPVL